MLARSDETIRRRQTRTPTACEFCRHRKMKCHNEKPQCKNCKEHGKRCVYAELAKKPRPSHARINQLEQENRELREIESNLRDQIKTVKGANEILSATLPQSSAEVARSGACNTGNQVQNCKGSPLYLGLRSAIPTSFSRDASFVHKPFSPDKESYYHGPTSDLFDEKSTKSEIRYESGTPVNFPDAWFERQLVAESASQRQLETINFMAGNLDFDGVDPDLGMHLLSIYWNRQHASAPVVYRPVFMREMASAGPYFSKLLLNAIYFYASKYTVRKEVRHDPTSPLTAGWIYRQRATELLSANFGNSSIATIQALLIMSNALFSWCDEKSTSWLYAGMAINMITDLGIHVNADILRSQFSKEDLEIRSRVFWSAYVIDKLQSLYQGRPARLRRSDTNLLMLFLDKYEELEMFSPLSYTEAARYPIAPVYSISSVVELCKISIILEEILLSIYSESSSSRNPEELHQERNLLHSKLENWRNSLPKHLDFKLTGCNPLPNTLSLLAMFNVLVILLHRPFVSDGHLHSASFSTAQGAFFNCSTAAFEIDNILKIYEQRFCHKSAPYIISYATYVSATIHVRLAAQQQNGSAAHKALRRCLDVLDIQQTVCWSPKRAKRVIGSLVDRMGVALGDDGHSSTETADLTAPNLDMDAIVLSFVREKPIEVPHIQQDHSNPGNDDAAPFVTSNSTKQPMAAHQAELLNEQSLPLTGEETDFLYDPIFGSTDLR